ncbi:MAG TPA: hypothetical protein VGP19_01890 [Candidatus Acidoferrales bacterium]|nr:hypothetical protein [Candidatus Acidoferrales bacterium]
MKKCALAAATLLLRHSRQITGHLRRTAALVVTFALSLAPGAPALYASPAPAKARAVSAGDDTQTPSDGCNLKSARGDIQHVIYIQFDNVHFTRDNPNVPSDLEQMPHLLNFLTDNGVLMSNHHTPLKSHTADDIITSLTGVYGDRHGQPIANTFDYFTPTSASYTSSFEYWTDTVSATYDPTYYMITPDGKNAPAPWVPWTRAGCNVGAVSIANMEFENVSSDLKTAFASNPTLLASSLAEANSNFNQAVADYEGISIHCAANNAVCASTNNGVADVLPQEPGGYTGYNALFGHKLVAPIISPGAPLTDLDGNPLTGFPGFGGISAAQTLSYVAAMQENGVPVTYAYISDVHDDHYGSNGAPGSAICNPNLAPAMGGDPNLFYGGSALGPGDACYEAQMTAYDEAFGKFFHRLEKDGINKQNTLFIITADEGDHFAGGAPFNASCDGVTTTCNYINPANNQSVIGELDADMAGLLNTEDNIAAGFDIQFDMVPVFYIYENPAVGSTPSRSFEKAASTLTAVNPRTGNTDKLTAGLADPVEMKLLHMITGDPDRTPSFVMFGDPDYYFQLTGDTTCSTPCVVADPGFAWNHGGIQKEIVTTWLGLVGPGVQNKGVDDDVWSDHTDIRPTMLALTGLKDDYQHEGRALVEEFRNWALPDGVSDSGDEFTELARAFKAINAPNAELGRESLRISTKALAGDDTTYANLEGRISGITAVRDLLASQMLDRLEDAEFNKQKISESDEQKLVDEAGELLDYVRNLAQH